MRRPWAALDAHVGAGEERGGEADEGGEGDQEDVEGVDEELVVEDEDGAVAGDADGESGGGKERGEADGDVEFGRAAARAEEGEQEEAEEREGRGRLGVPRMASELCVVRSTLFVEGEERITEITERKREHRGSRCGTRRQRTQKGERIVSVPR